MDNLFQKRVEMSRFTTDEEYRKNPKLRPEDIRYLQDWISKQPHLPAVPARPNFAVDKLRMQITVPKPFSSSSVIMLESAKSVIEHHYTIKTHATEIWSNRDPLSREIQDALDVTPAFLPLPPVALKLPMAFSTPLETLKAPSVRNSNQTILSVNGQLCLNVPTSLSAGIKLFLILRYMVLLPERDRSGNLVLLFRMANYEPSRFIQERASKALLMLNDVALLEHGTVPGLTLVLDSKGVGFNFLPRVSIPNLKKMIMFLQIVIHSSGLEDFYKIVPNEILPKEYGGEAGTIEEAHKRSYEKMKQHRNWFIEEEKLRVDESKRLGKAKSASDVFGLEGSFKKLDID
uniref:CRAL-TRIO domain-containing protein n=1 Tax=Timema poppense TaxID=170557 RepID=A0A7R9GYH5_TIMPO|nr:unnamed protein product [Timema poppensis]